MINKIILVFLFVLFYSIKGISQCNCNCDVERDSLALVSFQTALTDALTISPWDLSEPMDRWLSVKLNEDRCVTQLTRRNVKLSGELPPEIGNLKCLTVLNLSTNNLTGEIPIEITNLTCLASLSFSINNLSGAIPIEIGNLQNLESLGLNLNNLTGIIPDGIGTLSKLHTLALNDNNLEGCIPEGLLQFCGIDIFNLGGNFGLAFSGEEGAFCNGENQVGASCFIDGQDRIIDENCNCEFTTSVSTPLGKHKIKVYPNPFKQIVSIESNQFLIKELRVFDSDRILRFKQNLNESKSEINLTDMPSGIYFIEVSTKNQKEIIKIIKE